MTELYHLDVFKHTRTQERGEKEWREEGGTKMGGERDGERRRGGRGREGEGEKGREGRKWGGRVIPFENPNTTLHMQSKDKL